MDDEHKEIESFDEFVAIELRKLKKFYPDATVSHNVSIVEENDDDIPQEKDPLQELDGAIESIDDADSDESTEVVDEG